MFLWESSKFLLVIICHMTRFSEIWSACFRLGAHQHKWSGRGNSFKCQKSAKKAKIFRCLANHLRALVNVTQSCSHAKLFQSNIGKIAAGYFYFLIDWSIHQFTTLSLSTRSLLQQSRNSSPYVPLHSFHLLRSLPLLLLLLLGAFASPSYDSFSLNGFSSARRAFSLAFQPAI